MVFIFLTKEFQKDYAKKQPHVKDTFKKRLELLKADPRSSILRVHKLHGEYSGFKSFDVTGDVRVIYAEIEGGYELSRIDTHSELYG